MGKHTAGPWSIVENLVDGFTPDIVGETPNDIVCRLYGGQFEMVEANAALISAAPDLLQALEQVYSLMISAHSHASTEPETAWRTMHKAEDVARIALAKAKGQ